MNKKLFTTGKGKFKIYLLTFLLILSGVSLIIFWAHSSVVEKISHHYNNITYSILFICTLPLILAFTILSLTSNNLDVYEDHIEGMLFSGFLMLTDINIKNDEITKVRLSFLHLSIYTKNEHYRLYTRRTLMKHIFKRGIVGIIVVRVK